MPTTKSQPKIFIREHYRELYKENKILRGLFSWEQKIDEEKIGQDLIISTTEKFCKIIINGKELCQ